jgi:hypothetical protein
LEETRIGICVLYQEGYVRQAKSCLAIDGEPAVELSAYVTAGMSLEVGLQLIRAIRLDLCMLTGSHVERHQLPIHILTMFIGGVRKVLLDSYGTSDYLCAHAGSLAYRQRVHYDDTSEITV